jgi:hypothetical protein
LNKIDQILSKDPTFKILNNRLYSRDREIKLDRKVNAQTAIVSISNRVPMSGLDNFKDYLRSLKLQIGQGRKKKRDRQRRKQAKLAKRTNYTQNAR